MIDSDLARPNVSPPSKSCHNCRRKRLRCDRSIPDCQKCTSKGEKCLGYGKLLRWTNAVAVRGNLADQISQRPSHTVHSHTKDVVASHLVHPRRRQPPDTEFQPLQLSLIDPLLIDLAPRHRVYIGHCELHATSISNFRCTGLTCIKSYTNRLSRSSLFRPSRYTEPLPLYALVNR